MSGSEVVKAFHLVKQNIANTLKRLNRSEDTCRLVAVSKTKPIEAIKEIYDNTGHLHFGENYIQELCDKAQVLPKEIKWHFIGHLQSNKIKQLVEKVENLYMVETVDRVKIAQGLEKYWAASQRNNNLNILVQVNTSSEENKGGINTEEECLEVVKYILEKCPHLTFNGLMTIGSVEHSHQLDKNPDFEKLVEYKNYLLDQIETLKSLHPFELSMGMSSDYEMAIEYGSTNVRVGSTIFGARDYSKQ